MKHLATIFLLFPLLFSNSVFSLTRSEFYNKYIINYKNITLEDKLQQMLLVGFLGQHVTARDKQFLLRYKVGGFILFYSPNSTDKHSNIKNPAQLQNLIQALQANTEVPFFICIDQEGGTVERLKEFSGFRNISIPKASELGATKNPELVYDKASNMGKILAENHINVNFAPVVDTNVNPKNPVIGKLGRAYSSNTAEVFLYANEFVKAQHKHGIINVLKHFPGHGSSTADSHKGLVDVTNVYDKTELAPFSQFINNGFDGMIMVGHLLNKKVDNKPASISRNWITNVLREDLGFAGVVITDDLNMKAIKDNYSFEETIISAINSGADIILHSDYLQDTNNSVVDRTLNVVYKSMKNGGITQEQIDAAYLRSMQLKYKYYDTLIQ